MAPAVLLVLAALQAQDPVRVQARLNDQEVEVGQTTVLRVDVETQGERARIQRFRSLPPGIEVAGTRDYDQRQFSIPGGTRRFVSREFVLRARAPGRYRIPSIEVIVAGQTYSTRSELLTVTAGSPLDPSVPGGTDGSGVVLRAWVDADTVFVGEQVMLEAEAMFSQDARLRLRRSPQYEAPSPSGFWIHDLPDRRRPTTRAIDGQTYEVQQFRRILFPLTPGDYEIPPARLEYEMRRGLLYAPETRNLTSDPILLVVRPVPGDAPPDFTGAVGTFTATATLEPGRVPAGEAAVLTVEIAGAGNIKALPPPALPEMPGIDVFPPSEEAETRVQGNLLRGTKTFSWVLIPRDVGDLEIPEIRYAYFDPDEGGFHTTATGPITLSVEPGGAIDEIAAAPAIRYLRTEPGPGDPLGWVRSDWFAAAQAVPLLLLLAGFWRGRTRDTVRPASRRALRRRRADRLGAFEERAASDDPHLFADLEAFARESLADRLGIGTSDATRTDRLVAAGVTEDTARELQRVLERIASARYAPGRPAAAARREMVGALGRLLERVDAQAPAPTGSLKRRSRARAGAASTALVLMLPFGATQAAAVQTTDAEPTVAPGAAAGEAFRAGVVAYEEERFMDAAEAFDGYLDDRPEDAAGWYNLGAAYYRAGHRGYAVWAWLEVVRLDPRGADARHNLLLAGVAPELLNRVAPPLPLRPRELFLLAAIAWLAAGVAGGLWLTDRRAADRRRRGVGIAAFVALSLAGSLAAIGWISTRTPDTLVVVENTTLLAGPTLRGDRIADMAPGTGLVPVELRDDWIRVRTLRGDEGWVDAATTAEI